MIQVSRKVLFILSGLVWLTIGLILMPLGFTYLKEYQGPLFDALVPFLGSKENAFIFLSGVALVLGYFKGKKVLAKAAKKGCERLSQLPDPSPLSKIYPPKYYILLGSMVFIGMAAKLLPFDIRGLIDLAIGDALINGSLVYLAIFFPKKS